MTAADQKLDLGANGQPTTVRTDTDLTFPLVHPDCDPNNRKGEERLKVYCQILMRGLGEASRRPTNLPKIGQVIQGKEESLGAFLERLLEAYHTNTPLNPETREINLL